MNRINIKKRRANRRKKVLKTVAKGLFYIIGGIVAAFTMWAYVWIIYIIFGA